MKSLYSSPDSTVRLVLPRAGPLLPDRRASIWTYTRLGDGVRSQPMIIPHDPLEYTSNLVPMIHAHFVISTLEAAADESRALRKVAPCEDAGDGSEEAVAVSPSSARSRVSRAMYGALIASTVAACERFTANTSHVASRVATRARHR